MNLLKQSTKYNKYLERIKDYKLIADKNEAFSSIEVRVANLHQDLRANNHKAFYQRIYLGLLSISLILAVCSFIKGFTITGILLSVSAIASKYFYNLTLKRFVEASIAIVEKQDENSSFDLKLQLRMDYLQHGIDLKMSRIRLVRNSFMGIFTLSMIAGLSLSNVHVEISMFVLSIISLMISGGFWFYFFKDDLDVLEYQDMELAEYVQVFYAKCEVDNSIRSNIADEDSTTLTESNPEKKYMQDDQGEDDEFTEVVPPKTQEKSIDEMYKQLTLDV